MDTLNLFYWSIPFWIPAVVGLYLVVKRPGPLSLMAGLLTLKPIVATPIWVALLQNAYADRLTPAQFLSILPGAGLTLIAFMAFRPLFSGPQAGNARILLVLDIARWLNSFLMLLPYPQAVGTLACIFAPIGLGLPTLFALVAVTLSTGTTQETAS